MRRQTARGTATRRLCVSAGVLVVALAVLGGWAAATTTTVATAGLGAGASSTTTTVALATTTSTSVPPLYSHDIYFQATAGKTTQPWVDLSLGLPSFVTRGQAAVRLAEALGLTPGETSGFTDLTSEDECFGAVAALERLKLLTGATGDLFAPAEAVTRQQALAWITAALEYKLSRDGGSTVPFRFSFFDSAGRWLGGFNDGGLVDGTLARGVAGAYRLGLVDVPADGFLYPAFPLEEAALSDMLARAFSRTVVAKAGPPETLAEETGYPPLKLKSKGPLVWYLEYRLTALKYRPGPVDGVFDVRTEDAVYAFQKVEKLTRDGIAGAGVWERLATAQTPVPKADEPGKRVEVDIDRQVLLMIDENKVQKIIHVSTGGSGSRTLKGHFTIEYKMSSWVRCSYGTLIYYVSYFDFDHLLAVHGDPDVPPWADSHGCVRVPIWTAQELYEEMPMGTSVYIYDQ